MKDLLSLARDFVKLWAVPMMLLTIVESFAIIAWCQGWGPK